MFRTEEAAEDLDVDDYSLDKLLEDKLKREENDRNDDDSKSEMSVFPLLPTTTTVSPIYYCIDTSWT